MHGGILESTFWCGVAIALVACGGNTTGGVSQAEPVPETELVNRTVTAYCEGLRVCCQSRGLAFSATGCDAGLRQNLSVSGGVCDPGSTYDATAAGTCVQQGQSYVASCGNTPEPTACQRLCVGTLPVGAACDSTEQCAQPPNGEVDCTYGATARGTCTPLARGQLGQGCQGTCSLGGDCAMSSPTVGPGVDAGVPGNATCYTDDGLYCASNWTCQRLVSLGGACVDLQSCGNGAYCSTAGVCEAQKAAGATCTTYNECLDYCDTATGRCIGDSGVDVTAEICAGNFDGSSGGSSTPPVSVPPATTADAG